MKRFLPGLFILFVLLTGCLASQSTVEEKAASVPRLTRVMHAKAIQKQYQCDTNLSPEEVRQLFIQAIDENPSLDLFKGEQKSVRWCGGEVVLLLCDPKTGDAYFEDVSCTPHLDRRWYGSNSPPRNFTISHPETCGCGTK
jgi:hypothetical protein